VKRVVGLALLLAWPALAPAQEQPAGPKPVGAIAALSGKGTISRAAQPEATPAKLEDSVFVRDKIATGDLSVIRVLMGGRITITIRERSIVTITDDPARTRIDLQEGRVAFKVHDGGLRTGEVAELRTPNAITGIRGSLVVANVTGFDSEVTVVEARHTITIATRQSPARTTPVPVGHTVRITGPAATARITAVAKAAKDHLDKAADTAEVPGRAKDGGQERLYRFDPQVGRLLPTATKAPVAVPDKAVLEPERKPALQSPARVLTPPDKQDEPAATRVAPAPAARAPAAAAPTAPVPPVPAAPAAKAPVTTKAPDKLKRVTPGLTPNAGGTGADKRE
jgi:hypothetical protein